MARNPSPKVAEARRLAKVWGQKQVIIIMIDDDTLSYVSYGADKKLCADARRLADIAYEAIMLGYREDKH